MKERRNIELDSEEWLRIEQLAAETSSRPKKGANAHQPCWRTMMRRMARNEIVVAEKNPDPRLAVLDEAIKRSQQQPERRGYQQLSILEPA